MLHDIGDIVSDAFATIVIFEPGGGPSQRVNLLLLQAEDPNAGLAFSLRIPFAGNTLASRLQIPGGVTDASGRRQRIELALKKGEQLYLAGDAIVTLRLTEDRLHGRIERAQMVPSPDGDEKGFELIGRFEAPMEVTCWSQVRGTGETASRQPSTETPLFRLEYERTSPFCAGLTTIEVEAETLP